MGDGDSGGDSDGDLVVLSKQKVYILTKNETDQQELNGITYFLVFPTEGKNPE